MQMGVYGALTSIGVTPDKAEAAVRALDDHMDKRMNEAMNVGMSAVRSDIATLSADLKSLSAETKASIACLSSEMKNGYASLNSEIKRLDDKIDGVRTLVEKTSTQFLWILSFVVAVCSVATAVISRVIP
jgi:hypothetical protein